MPTLKQLLAALPQQGKLEWIGLRPAKREAVLAVEQAVLTTDSGLEGDRYAGRSGNRHVTLIQAEHLPVMASLLHVAEIPPAMLRRNLLVSGVNLLALKGKQFQVGEALLEYTGQCHPCSRMEEYFGAGGYNAVRGHGGITARVLRGGNIAIGSRVVAVTPVANGS